MGGALPYVVLLVVLVVTFLLKVPIAWCMIASAASFFFLSGSNMGLVADKIMGSLYGNYVIIAIPLFIFTANAMNSGRVTEKMFTFVKALIGPRSGALGHVNVVASLVFSGMTGSAIADASGLGLMEVSAMREDGYDDGFSCALTAASSTIGPIFPPSIPLVIYSMLSGASTGALLMGGMVPAILLAIVLCLYVAYISKKRNYPKGQKFTPQQFLKYTFSALPALFTPVILLTAIYTGIVTTTEAGALAATWALIVSFIVYRTLNFKGLLAIIKDTALQTGTVVILTCSAVVFSHVVTTAGLTEMVSTFFMTITDNKYVFLLLINIIFFVLGMFLDTNTLQYIIVPMILPVVSAFGIDLVHFGVVIVLNMMIGMSTPPYGMLCFIVSTLFKVPLKDVFREIWPMVGAMVVALLMITYIPGLVTFIPSLLL